MGGITGKRKKGKSLQSRKDRNGGMAQDNCDSSVGSEGGEEASRA